MVGARALVTGLQMFTYVGRVCDFEEVVSHNPNLKKVAREWQNRGEDEPGPADAWSARRMAWLEVISAGKDKVTRASFTIPERGLAGKWRVTVGASARHDDIKRAPSARTELLLDDEW